MTAVSSGAAVPETIGGGSVCLACSPSAPGPWQAARPDSSMQTRMYLMIEFIGFLSREIVCILYDPFVTFVFKSK
jgi:hypothetical protein